MQSTRLAFLDHYKAVRSTFWPAASGAVTIPPRGKPALLAPVVVRPEESAVTAYDAPIGPPHLVVEREKMRFIVRGIAAQEGFSFNDIMSHRRDAKLAECRKYCIYLVKCATTCTLLQIGKFFDRDHTVVLYSVRCVEASLRGEVYRRPRNNSAQACAKTVKTSPDNAECAMKKAGRRFACNISTALTKSNDVSERNG